MQLPDRRQVYLGYGELGWNHVLVMPRGNVNNDRAVIYLSIDRGETYCELPILGRTAGTSVDYLAAVQTIEGQRILHRLKNGQIVFVDHLFNPARTTPRVDYTVYSLEY